MIFAAVLLAALCVGLCATPLVARAASLLGVMDHPNWRKVHRHPVPRLGGVAVFIAWFCAFWLGIVLMQNQFPDMQKLVSLAYIGAAVVALGIIDDWRDVSGGAKLAAQIFIATLVFLADVRIDRLSIPFVRGFAVLPWWLSYGVTVLWILGMMNAMNLIDGLDGLAAGMAVIIAYGLIAAGTYLDSKGSVLMLTCLAGACLGFLRYNFHPAKIFLGDSGSQLLGYLFAVSVIAEDQFKASAAVSLLIPLSAMTLPIFDTALAVARRVRGHRSIFRADRFHLHHRLLKMGLTHKQVVLFFYLISLYLSFFAFLFVLIRENFAVVLLALLGLGLFMGMQTLRFLEWTLRRRLRLAHAKRR